jgi:ectoine hydroxylase-related dioxygenase (phytanoyl-CoA dioxygenase family)
MHPFDLQQFETNGVTILSEVPADLDLLTACVTSLSGDAVRQKRRSVHAVCNLLGLSPVREWVRSPAVRAIIDPLLGHNAVAVRGILFDKTPDANWKVAWHQDLSIAVADRAEVSGYGPWSMKSGVTLVQPPIEVLQQMCTIRLHLDACDATNGPLKVIAGSHRNGILNDTEIATCVRRQQATVCEVPRGGAVLMRPLLLHASSAAERPGHRRVVHIEFCSAQLPAALEWADVA